ncbi:MAG: nascent polypeptide-associated complex protein [Candidatus Aenigmarchaeota archaeon]|nr:nascent polypeptide-associated complex protein [Candidatus Aenigmarchaeota archaeon]
MLPGINPRQMQGMMRKLGIKQEDIEAEEVIIKTKDKNIIIKNPQVSLIEMSGNKSFQITGKIVESSINENDIETVAEKARVSLNEAKKALEISRGDLAEAILSLQKD